MHASITVLLSICTILVNAHFQLQFPLPRGPFVEDDEPNFCDGFTDVTKNRTNFPVSGGFFILNSEHPSWTTGVQISTAGNPSSFNDFSLVVPFFNTKGEGRFCIPLDFSKSNASLTDNQNVTIQVVFDGGDGQLYQCADLTVGKNFNVSSDVASACSSATAAGNTTATSGGNTSGSSATSSGAPPPATSTTSDAVSRAASTASIGAVVALIGFCSALMW